MFFWKNGVLLLIQGISFFLAPSHKIWVVGRVGCMDWQGKRTSKTALFLLGWRIVSGVALRIGQKADEFYEGPVKRTVICCVLVTLCPLIGQYCQEAHALEIH